MERSIEFIARREETAPGKRHVHRMQLVWAGNRGSRTSAYSEYCLAHGIRAGALKLPIAGSSDRAIRGDASRWNPEDLLVGAVSACHKPWHLHLAASDGAIVTACPDDAEGIMLETERGGGRFERITLRARVTIAGGDDALAQSPHREAHAKCFLAQSMGFPVIPDPAAIRAGGAPS